MGNCSKCLNAHSHLGSRRTLKFGFSGLNSSSARKHNSAAASLPDTGDVPAKEEGVYQEKVKAYPHLKECKQKKYTF